jgi:hypothetical protein
LYRVWLPVIPQIVELMPNAVFPAVRKPFSGILPITSLAARKRGDPHCDDRRPPSSFEERQEILDHEVAGHVHHGSDNHQHKGEPHP